MWDQGLQLDPYKSVGPHLRILKMLLMSSQNLPMMFEQSRESGGVPADWKLANVVPLFKKKEDPGNHRPVKSHFSAQPNHGRDDFGKY